MDARPFLKDGRTFVPVRFLSNALGVEDKNILWDDPTKKVTLSAWNRVEMTVGSPAIAVTSAGVGQPDLKIIDVAPLLKNEEGRTYLPARYVAEALGYDVEWDERSQTVMCWPKGDVKPDVSTVKHYIKTMTGTSPSVAETKPGYKNVSGFLIPEDTQLVVDGLRGSVPITIAIVIPRGDLDRQYNQAREILAGKYGEKIADEAIKYAKSRVDYGNLDRKAIKLDGEGAITVEAAWNAPRTYIEVWNKYIW